MFCYAHFLFAEFCKLRHQIKCFVTLKLGIEQLLNRSFKTNDPIFKAVLEKSALASQPTVSGFYNRMDEDTLIQFLKISRILRKRIYSIQMPQAVILDLDSTLLEAYGRQDSAHALAYNIFNWFRRLVLSAKMRKHRIDTVRLKLLKIAAKVVHSARYVTFKLCSSCPYKEEFYDTLSTISKLNVQLE